MDGLNRSNCAFALDGTCKFAPEQCATCKVDKPTSDIHGSLCIGCYTFEDVQRMQHGLPPLHRYGKSSKTPTASNEA